MNCCICGPVKNCGAYLRRVFNNIEKLAELFDDYRIIIYYDQSTDDTLNILKTYQLENNKLSFYENNNFISPFRTHRIAHARNYCIKEIKEKYADYPFFIMMDFDDPNSKNCNPEIIKKYLTRDDWDALSFNTTPRYRDIWALSIYPFCFSYNHFKNNTRFYRIIQKYVTDKLNALSSVPNGNGLLECISAFNAFALYKTSKFLNCSYNGKVNLNLLPKRYMETHMAAAQSPIIFKDYGHVKGEYEDCEHRAFHVEAKYKNGARIMISPEVVFR